MAVRLRVIASAAGAAGAIGAIGAWLGYAAIVRPRLLRWGATEAEMRRALPGDELVRSPELGATRAITIDAPPAAVWPWLVQQGYGRAGWYSYRIDNRWRRSPDHIVPELQQLAVGDLLPTSEDAGFRVAALEPGRYLVLLIDGRPGVISAVQWLEPLDGGRTRLIQRVRAYFAPTPGSRLFGLVFPLGDFVFMRAQMRGIRRRAERRA